MKKTPDINYGNARFDNTTILMYSIDESKEAATDLIISCFKDELDINLSDIKGENTIFHLINNDNFSQKTKIDFIKDLGLKDFNLYSNFLVLIISIEIIHIFIFCLFLNINILN